MFQFVGGWVGKYKAELYLGMSWVVHLLTERMRVGPKGQVVIPRSFRKILKIGPGSEVIFTLEGDKVIVGKEPEDPIGNFEAISKKGRSVSKVNPHAYERELEERNP